MQREDLECIGLILVLCRDVLGKSINIDEVVVFGVVYYVVDFGKGFKVKKFLIKDVCYYFIVVSMDFIIMFKYLY